MKNKTNQGKIDENLEKIATLEQTFQHTPLLEFTLKYKEKVIKLFAKNEISGFSGSIKDRMVANILKKAYLNGNLKIDDTIIEVTSGCTGIALSAIGGLLGHKIEILIPDWFSKARYAMTEILGAEIHKISKAEGGFFKCLEIAAEKSKKPGYFYLNQFNNKENIDAHFHSTAPEIFEALKSRGDKFILSTGVGTGGTIIGIHKYCLQNNIDCLCYPMEPESSPLLRSKGEKIGTHRIEGIADDFIPKNCNLDTELFKEVIGIDDGDAILMARKISRFGFAVGISSGGNFLATLKAAEEYGFSRIPVTIFPDGAVKYTSTDLFKNEPMRDKYLSKNIEIIDLKILHNNQNNCFSPST